MGQRGCTGGLTPHRSPDVCAYSLFAVQKFGRVIGQHAADDATLCVGHRDYAQRTAAVRTLWALWFASIRLRRDSASQPIRPTNRATHLIKFCKQKDTSVENVSGSARNAVRDMAIADSGGVDPCVWRLSTAMRSNGPWQVSLGNAPVSTAPTHVSPTGQRRPALRNPVRVRVQNSNLGRRSSAFADCLAPG